MMKPAQETPWWNSPDINYCSRINMGDDLEALHNKLEQLQKSVEIQQVLLLELQVAITNLEDLVTTLWWCPPGGGPGFQQVATEWVARQKQQEEENKELTTKIEVIELE